MLYKKYAEIVGTDGLDKYFDVWLKYQFGDSYKGQLKKAGITGGLFMKCAIFDLHECNGMFDKVPTIIERKKQNAAKSMREGRIIHKYQATNRSFTIPTGAV